MRRDYGRPAPTMALGSIDGDLALVTGVANGRNLVTLFNPSPLNPHGSVGLADPNLWTNHAQLVDVGANWYLNQFVKVYFDWEHALFGSPVFSATGHLRRSNDLFWVRTQLFF